MKDTSLCRLKYYYWEQLLFFRAFHFFLNWLTLSYRSREDPLNRFLSIIKYSGYFVALFKIYANIWSELKSYKGTFTKWSLFGSSESENDYILDISTLDFDGREFSLGGFFDGAFTFLEGLIIDAIPFWKNFNSILDHYLLSF